MGDNSGVRGDKGEEVEIPVNIGCEGLLIGSFLDEGSLVRSTVTGVEDSGCVGGMDWDAIVFGEGVFSSSSSTMGVGAADMEG